MVADYWEESGGMLSTTYESAPVSRTTRTATAQQVVSITELNNEVFGAYQPEAHPIMITMDCCWRIWVKPGTPLRRITSRQTGSNCHITPINRICSSGVLEKTLIRVYFQHLQLDYEYDLFVGESSPELQVETSVFPNPTTDRLEVRLNPESPTDATFNYTLADQNGRIVESRYYADKQETFFMQLLTYFLRIEQDGAMRTLPVVKM